ncbi:type 1 glutamine amidotransferase [Mycolicibacterium setense]|uniref:type 1 glutamine amidotransferase n=1 Tax=Mycolicibacterium setense TaxID=431269 RepID=UPI000573B073|nr:gamma-glutamyl-gamma-aminobutyrate hydrolase family protein [Mycolicibacterium setense]KHO18967.1 glutamine amidotransferase [Mycolicibacterium setense]MCV7112819.1 gamma-glutamyl-gamma-aminobutyrate hydrolase family protein [Mycolicibacterium setense]
MTPTVLFLRNDHTATEAMLADVFTECGFDIDTFDVVSPDREDAPAGDVAFPEPTGYDVIVPLGARWPVYDEALVDSWVGAEMDMVRRAVESGVGVLGVCFGGQLIAQALGGSVSRSPAPEVGWYNVATDDAGLVPGGRWFQWHFDRWTIPPGAIEIARTPAASQAFVLGTALALQFHPELDSELLEVWLAHDRDGSAAGIGTSHHELRSETKEFTGDAAARLHILVRGFLNRVVRPQPST